MYIDLHLTNLTEREVLFLANVLSRGAAADIVQGGVLSEFQKAQAEFARKLSLDLVRERLAVMKSGQSFIELDCERES